MDREIDKGAILFNEESIAGKTPADIIKAAYHGFIPKTAWAWDWWLDDITIICC